MIFSNIYTVYITSNRGRTVFYKGVTNNIQRRIVEHYNNRGNLKTFAGRYYCYELIYYESYFFINEAIEREKQI
jgi:putative endonuclease